MKVEEFTSKLEKLVTTNTVYALGTYGQTLTNELINAKARQLPNWYTANRIKTLQKYIGVTAFDCSGMIKAILWGYPNTKYGQGQPDLSADQLISSCSNIGTDFTKIEEGNVVWLKGHIGVYHNGYVIECSPKWANGVQITELTARKWLKYGRLPAIEYSEKLDNTNYNKLTVCTNFSNLNIRSGAGLGYKVIGQFKKNTKVEILEKAGDWYKVKGVSTANIEVIGYCNKAYLKGAC